MQFYTDKRTENARVEDGHLIIEARKEKWEDNDYTSARLVTRGKEEWKYGKIEVKAKLPKGRGTWPAIWMLAANDPMRWPDDGEIDIMEHVGYDQGKVHGSVHTKKYNHVIKTQKTGNTMVPDCSEEFHVYGVEWDKDNVKISVDDKPYFEFKNEQSGYEAWPFDNKLFLLLNVGGRRRLGRRKASTKPSGPSGWKSTTCGCMRRSEPPGYFTPIRCFRSSAAGQLRHPSYHTFDFVEKIMR